MRCQEGEEDDPPLVPRLGTRTGSTLLFSTTTRFCDMKQKRNYSFLTSRSIAKTSYTIRSSGVLLQTGRVFIMIFIVGVKSYMEVSNETSDTIIITHNLPPFVNYVSAPALCIREVFVMHALGLGWEGNPMLQFDKAEAIENQYSHYVTAVIALTAVLKVLYG